MRIAKLFHFLGLAVFIGSIAVYIVASQIAGSELQALVVARRIIRAGTVAATVPALWLALTTGLLLGRRVGVATMPRWLKAKLGLVALVVINTHVIIVPATAAALAAARDSLAAGALLAAYQRAYLVESAAGAANVILALTLAALAVLRPKLKDR